MEVYIKFIINTHTNLSLMEGIMELKELQEKILELTDLNNTLKNDLENQKKLLEDKETELKNIV